jgi:hypothetical protein
MHEKLLEYVNNTTALITEYSKRKETEKINLFITVWEDLADKYVSFLEEMNRKSYNSISIGPAVNVIKYKFLDKIAKIDPEYLQKQEEDLRHYQHANSLKKHLARIKELNEEERISALSRLNEDFKKELADQVRYKKNLYGKTLKFNLKESGSKNQLKSEFKKSNNSKTENYQEDLSVGSEAEGPSKFFQNYESSMISKKFPQIFNTRENRTVQNQTRNLIQNSEIKKSTNRKFVIQNSLPYHEKMKKLSSSQNKVN